MGTTVLVCGAGAVGARAARHLLADEAVDTVLVADANRKRRTAVVAALVAPGRGRRRARPLGGGRGGGGHAGQPPGRPRAPGRERGAPRRLRRRQRGDRQAPARPRRRGPRAGRDRGAGRRVLARPVVPAGLPRGVRLRRRRGDPRRQAGDGRPRLCPPAPCRPAHRRGSTGATTPGGDGRRGRGRELSFFPDPIGGADCYRASLPDGLLLVPAFPGVERVTARLAATRRDRFTASLPMLRRPHTEGRIGGLRVEGAGPAQRDQRHGRARRGRPAGSGGGHGGRPGRPVDRQRQGHPAAPRAWPG